MLICSTCGGHFEARKNPGANASRVVTWRMSTCALRDGGSRASVRTHWRCVSPRLTTPCSPTWLLAERNQLQTEVDRLVASIAAGVPADTVAPLIQTKQATIRKLDTRLRAPKVPRLNHERLRAALDQRAAQWKADLRAEPQIARMMLRRLIGPLTLWDESERPEWIKWEAVPTTELLDGLATLQVASPAGFEPAF